MWFTGQYLKGPGGPLDNLFHSHPIVTGFLATTASHGSMPLGVLVRSYQQVAEPGDGVLLTQRGVIGCTEGQIADGSNSGLMGETRALLAVITNGTNSAKIILFEF